MKSQRELPVLALNVYSSTQGSFENSRLDGNVLIRRFLIYPTAFPPRIHMCFFCRYILDLNKSQVDGFAQRVASMTREVGFSPADPAQDVSQSVDGCFAKFVNARCT